MCSAIGSPMPNPATSPRNQTSPNSAAVQSHLDRCAPGATAERGIEGGVHVRYPLPEPAPSVSLIIPTRNGLRLLRQCVQSILDKTDYPHYEIVIVDNGSDEASTLDYLQSLRSHPRIRVHCDDRPFNFPALNNAAAGVCRGELLGLVNNDIEVIDGSWLREMASLAWRHDVVAVGARLWFADDTLQHAGVILGIGGVAGHVHRQLPRAAPGYHGRALLTQEFSAVTAACMLLRREVFDAMGGLDEANLAVDYNDIDFCLRIRRSGLRVVWTPHAQLYHHESATRGTARAAAAERRYQAEVAFMQKSWGPLLRARSRLQPQSDASRHTFRAVRRSRASTSIEPWYSAQRPPLVPPLPATCAGTAIAAMTADGAPACARQQANPGSSHRDRQSIDLELPEGGRRVVSPGSGVCTSHAAASGFGHDACPTARGRCPRQLSQPRDGVCRIEPARLGLPGTSQGIGDFGRELAPPQGGAGGCELVLRDEAPELGQRLLAAQAIGTRARRYGLRKTPMVVPEAEIAAAALCNLEALGMQTVVGQYVVHGHDLRMPRN